MKLTMIKIMLILSSMTLVISNPMSMGFILMMQTMIVIIFMNKILLTSWFAMITFLMMIGGLLIMFMYMSSVASNEKFKIKINLMLMMIILIIPLDEMLSQHQTNDELNIIELNKWSFALTKIYNEKSMMLTMLLVLYLLLTMISITKMVKHHKGSLRALN